MDSPLIQRTVVVAHFLCACSPLSTTDLFFFSFLIFFVFLFWFRRVLWTGQKLPNFHHLAIFRFPYFGLLGLSPHSSLSGPNYGSAIFIAYVKQFFFLYKWSLLLVVVILVGFIAAFNKLCPSNIWI